jgi:hypothetical protein
MAMRSVRSTSWSDARIVTVRSFAILMSMSVGIDGRDDVGAGLPGEDDEHCGLAVREPEIAQILHRVEHLGHVGKAYRSAVAVGDDEAAILLRLARLIVVVDLEALRADVDRALGRIGIGRGQRGAHVLEADAVFEERAGIELDAHGRQRAAPDLDLSDTGDL